MSADRSDLETIRNHEQRLLLREVRHSREELEKVLADDFCEVGSSGRLFSRQAIIDTMTSESVRELVMTEFEATVLAEDVVLTTFRILRYIQDQVKASSRHSSVWKKRGDSWWMVYHQGTLEPKSETS